MKCYSVTLLAILVVINMECSAQFNMPVTTTIHTPHGSIPLTYYVPGSGLNNNNRPNISVKHKYRIELNNDSSFVMRTKINSSEKTHFVTVENKTKLLTVKPSQTKSITCVKIDGQEFKGIPADTCWLFKIHGGKITTYSFIPDIELNLAIAMQEKDGPIVPIKKEILLTIMGDYPKLLKLIEKDKYLKAIETYNAMPYSSLKK